MVKLAFKRIPDLHPCDKMVTFIVLNSKLVNILLDTIR